MKKIYLILIAVFLYLNSFAQVAQGCDGQRYILDLFPTSTKTTIQYATNKNVLGENQKLYMDVYTPDGDTVSQRPETYPASFLKMTGDQQMREKLGEEKWQDAQNIFFA